MIDWIMGFSGLFADELLLLQMKSECGHLSVLLAAAEMSGMVDNSRKKWCKVG